MSRLGELLNTLQNVHPRGARGAPGAPRGAPLGGPPGDPDSPPLRGYPPGSDSPAQSARFPNLVPPRRPSVRSVSDPQTFAASSVRPGRSSQTLMTRAWVPSPPPMLLRIGDHLPRVTGASRVEQLAGWGDGSLAGAFTPGVFSPAFGDYLFHPPPSHPYGCNVSPSRRWWSCVAMTASSSGLWLVNRAPGVPIPRPLRGVLRHHGAPWGPLCHRRRGPQGPPRAPDPRGAKKCTFLPPCGAKS